MVLSTLVVPLPEELALLGAGYLANQGSVSLPAAYIASLAAILVGDTTTFVIGRSLLPRFLRTRWGKQMVKPGLRRWAETLVQRHGFRAVLLGRFLVALRGPVYLAIGAARFPTWRFVALNTAVAVIEVAIIVGIGYAYGASHELVKDLRWLEIGIGVVLSLALIVFPVLLKRRIEREHAA